MEEIKNGVLQGTGQLDWFQGANSPIVPDINVSDWKDYKIEHEIQWTGTYDTLFCVTYSALDCIGSLFMYYIANGLMAPDNVKWLQDNGYFKNGFINFNERFIGTLGGTTNQGAYQFKVANAINNNGLIPQDMFPLADNFNDNIDTKFITTNMRILAAEFRKRFTINFEWVTDFIEAIKHSPIQVTVKYADYNNPEDILKPEGTPNHAVKCVYKNNLYNEIDDTYWQRYKRYDPAYTYSPMSFKLTINNISMDTNKWLKDNDKKWVRNSNSGAFGRVLQEKLFVFNSIDRGALALLDDKVRENGVQITNNEWEQLPKQNF